MTYRVIVLPSAELDITNAAAWIADHSPAAAASWVEGIRDAINTLGVMPSRCPVAQGLLAARWSYASCSTVAAASGIESCSQ